MGNCKLTLPGGGVRIMQELRTENARVHSFPASEILQTPPPTPCLLSVIYRYMGFFLSH